MNDTPTARAPVTEADALKAALKDEINFDIRTRANKIPESVVDQIIDILAARGLLSIAHPPAAEREAPGGVLTRIRQLVEEAEEEDGPAWLPSKDMTLLGAVCEEIAAAPPPPANIGDDR